MMRQLSGVALFILLPAAAGAQVKLLAVGSVPASAVDKSGLTEKLEDGTPHNLLGGFGSGIAWTGKGNRYVLVPDRGPGSNVSYQCRFHLADIQVAGDEVHFDLLETKLLRNKMGTPFVGASHALHNRLDPEGIRVSAKGTIYLSDEYGPHLLEFDSGGNWIRSFEVPAAFQIYKPSGVAAEELRQNAQGRVPNRGLEGLALSLDGKALFGAMQGPLIQDGGRAGLYCRLLEVDIASGKTRQFVYTLENTKTGINEIVAIAPGEYLVLERDGKKVKSRVCKIYRVRLAKATDVSSVASLPKAGLPAGIVPVTKSLFLDMTLLGLDLPPKIEGLAFGPDFPDGRKLLLVTSDNDFLAGQPTMIYAFSVAP
ncbi:MAG TPA: esterase-like activity of phytase family protein [Gemmataceae bacterium]|nr:esterase-like activity of phytase family protein [Gemmataceae bacterium]